MRLARQDVAPLGRKGMTDQSKRALIVDDDAEISQMLCSALLRHGLPADSVGDGAAAIEALGTNGYSVVLLDLAMPTVDGFAVIDWIERHPKSLRAQPVLIVMAEAEPLRSLNAQSVHGIIRKPFDAEELAGLVTACAEVKARAALGTMAFAALISGGPLLALLNRFNG